MLLDQVARHLRVDLGVDHAIQRTHPFLLDRHILLYHFGDFHHGWTYGGLFLGLFAATDKQCEDNNKEQDRIRETACVVPVGSCQNERVFHKKWQQFKENEEYFSLFHPVGQAFL